MIRKICPICDQPMGPFHYCKNCRQFVKRPYVRDVTYYLNESRPEEEISRNDHGMQGRRGQAASKNGKGRGRKIWFVILGIFVLVRITGGLVKVVRKSYVPAASYEADEHMLLSDEQVQKEGKACNSNGHYSISGARMAEEMEKILEEAGYRIDSVESSSWNYVNMDGEEPWTDYETSVLYFVSLAGEEQEEEQWDSVTVSYDTATGQLHGVDFYAAKADVTAFMAGRIAEFLQEQGDIPMGEDYGEMLKDDILKFSDREEDEEASGNWREIPEDGDGQTEVYFRESDGGFYVWIWREKD